MNLSTSQQQALQSIESFLDSERSIFILKGYAGTGKTTILRGLVARLRTQNQPTKLMAPTGRAAMILSEKTEREALTIHKSIFNFSSLLEADDSDDFDFYFGLNVNEDDEDCVYFIDECSMVGNRFTRDEFFQFGSGYLLNDLLEYCIGDARKNRKIIFIGDPAQLPPVGSNISPIFEDKFTSSNEIEKFELTEIFRQKDDSGILDNSIMLRDCIFGSKSEMKINFISNDVSEIDRAQLNDRYIDIAKTDSLAQTIVLCHSNRAALAHVQNIRCMRYSSEDINLIPQKRDRLLITRNDYRGDITLFNGMFVDIVEVGDIIRDETIFFKKRGGETGKERIRWRRVKITGTSLNQKFEAERYLIEDLLLSPDRALTEDQTIALYVDFKNRMSSQNIKKGSEEYKRALRTDEYFSAMHAKYAYAITVHKSQGGEWKSAIVDMATCMNNRSSGYLRWLYTAITRAKSKLYCIDPSAYSPISDLQLTTINLIKNPIEKAYYYPIDSNVVNSFIPYQENRIIELCAANEISVSFNDSQNLREFHFSNDNETVICKYWYGNSFYKTRKWSTSSELQSLCDSILNSSIIPDDVPFIPSFDFQQILNDNLTELCTEIDIKITNIIQSQYSDTYYFLTDSGLSEFIFYFKDKGFYRSIVARSEDIEDPQIKFLLESLAI